MSTLKVNKLRDTAGSADAIVLDPNGGAVLAGVTTVTSVKVGAAVTISESGIEASGIGITCANINGTQIGGRRNIIINGAMNVAQRGSSSTSDGYQTVDRFQVSKGGTDENPTQAQVDVSSGTTPYTEGFRKALKVTNGNQTGGAGTSDNIIIRYKAEAQDIANSGWNYTSSSSFITLSFWIKSSVAQEFQITLVSVDGSSYVYPTETPSLSANTWTKITKTIPGNSNLSFNNDNGEGLRLIIVGYCGSDYSTDSATENAWNAYSSGNQFGRASTSTWYETDDATLEITGVQLEVGSQATAFEHRSFGEELALCLRYYEKTYPYGVALGGSNSYTGFINQTGSSNSSGSMVIPIYFAEKRASPTMTAYNASNGNSGTWYVLRNGASGHNSVTIDQISTQRARLYFPTGANWIVASAEGHFEANAEL